MKKNLLLFKIATVTIISIALVSCSSSRNVAQTTVTASPDDVSITYQDFYDGLSPYGTWVDYPAYGHVWHPGVGADFRPYATNGRWMYSNAGWAWASDYNWGWAPFHYGRWIYDDAYGWLWIPGYEWSPAWVTWGYSGNFYCWAPLTPGIHLGVSAGAYMPHSIYWNAVDRGHITDNNIGVVLQHRDVINNIQNNITVINNYNNTSIHNQVYAKGPEVNEVEKYTNQHITPVAIHNVKSASEAKVTGNEMNVYRPNVQHAQPREFRTIESNNGAVHPIKEATEKPIGERREQMDNINRLPVRTAPAATFAHPSFTPPAGGGRRRH